MSVIFSLNGVVSVVGVVEIPCVQSFVYSAKFGFFIKARAKDTPGTLRVNVAYS